MMLTVGVNESLNSNRDNRLMDVLHNVQEALFAHGLEYDITSFRN